MDRVTCSQRKTKLEKRSSPRLVEAGSVVAWRRGSGARSPTCGVRLFSAPAQLSVSCLGRSVNISICAELTLTSSVLQLRGKP